MQQHDDPNAPHGYVNGRPVRLIGSPVLRRGAAAPLRRHFKVQVIRYLDGAGEGETWPLGKLNAAMARRA